MGQSVDEMKMGTPQETPPGTSESRTWLEGAAGRASHSKSRGPGFDPYKRHCVVSLSKTH